ncbi:TPA: hypothetical protein DD449_03770 [Candidatus Berkelbacteria bacterium]|uniref:EamA domain-containing protein n=1 Tax=Berkelbacteria bacterium GW2011_GWE1_39_12 TaxID=1618337 RepID=A0A0G4B2K2_9BACT|nr:MAG: hypothetical protein UT28_C0001G0390 [Berkelbacteria bacterium GW2011_GWE1_39_12]HBO60774.1 hypothetical protein [Candidatus Berkelbacteria bacterium]
MPLWLLPVLGRVLVGNGLFPVILKQNVGLPSRTRRFLLQFFFCTIFALIVAIATHHVSISHTAIIIFVIGLFNGFAAFAQWKAIDISLSRTSLFTFWDDIIAMALSLLILHEGRELNAGVYTGIILSLGAVVFFAIHSYQQRIHSNPDAKAVPFKFYLYVGFYSIIWGLATFAMRYLGVKNVSIGAFLAPWYLGALVAAFIILLRVDKKAITVALKTKDIAWMLALSSCVFVSLALTYKAYSMAPQNVVQPYFLIGEMILPTLIGLYFFKEVKGLDKSEKLVFSIAIIGGIIIAISKL